MISTVIESLKKKGSGTTDKGVERAQAILAAAREIFASEGYVGLSMRGVAARVKVSLSTVQHYYQDKDTLVEAVLLYMIDDYRIRIEQLNQRMTGESQLVRLSAAMDLLLADTQRPEVASVFVEIWSLANRSSVAANIVRKVRVREQKEFQRLIHGLLPNFSEQEYAMRAALMIAQIEGLTVRCSREDGDHFSIDALMVEAHKSLIRMATQP
jgi:AcrR family transcriptional regulator